MHMYNVVAVQFFYFLFPATDLYGPTWVGTLIVATIYLQLI